jgi:hypothetical protein
MYVCNWTENLQGIIDYLALAWQKNFLPRILIICGMTFEFDLGEFEFIFENNLGSWSGDQKFAFDEKNECRKSRASVPLNKEGVSWNILAQINTGLNPASGQFWQRWYIVRSAKRCHPCIVCLIKSAYLRLEPQKCNVCISAATCVFPRERFPVNIMRHQTHTGRLCQAQNTSTTSLCWSNNIFRLW